MPIQECEVDGKPGWRYGATGKCYTYERGNDDASRRAKKKAVKQAIAIGGGTAPSDLSDRELAEVGLVVRTMTKWCRSCAKVRPEANFRKDERTRDGLATVCEDCRETPALSERNTATRARLVSLAERAGIETGHVDRLYNALETVDLDGVEILSAGGPYHGTGSPPEGDFFDVGYLQEIASANTELAEEIQAPIKIGHGKKQTLLANSGLSIDEQPAAGWLENYRVVGDKLLADLKSVPRTLADLVKAKAFRHRSVEISRVTSQAHGGKVYDSVVTGLALLGAKAPAVRTLQDIAAWYAELLAVEPISVVRALYEDDAEPEVERSVDYQGGTVVWDVEDGAWDWMSDLCDALNEGGISGWVNGEYVPSRYSVIDVDQVNLSALVSDRDADDAVWVVPFSLQDGEPVPAPEDQWTLATAAYIVAGAAEQAEEATEMAERFRALAALSERGADTSGMTDLAQLSDEQIAEMARLFGIEEADVGARRTAVLGQMRTFAGEQPPTPAPPTPAPPAPTPPAPTPPDTSRAMADRLATLEAERERDRIERREASLNLLLSQARIEAASADDFRRFYDADPDLCIRSYSAIPPNMQRLGVFGQDSGGNAAVEAAQAGEQFYANYAAATGVRGANVRDFSKAGGQS